MKRLAFLNLLLFLCLSARAQDGLGIKQPFQIFRVSEPVTAIDVTTDGQKLAVADRNCASIFDLKRGALVRVFDDQKDLYGTTHNQKSDNIYFWPNNNNILFDGFVRNITNGAYTALNIDPHTIVAISSDKTRLVSSYIYSPISPPSGFVFVAAWHIPSQMINVITRFGSTVTDGAPYALAISPDKSKVIEGCNTGKVYLWNINSSSQSKPILSFKAHSDTINSIQFNPANGNQILTASWDGTARIWDLTTRKNIKTYKHDVGGIKCAVFSPDGRFVLTGGSDCTARLWRTATGAKALAYHGHDQPVSCVAFTPDGRKALTGSWDRTVRLWPVPRN